MLGRARVACFALVQLTSAVSALKLTPCGLFSGRWCGVAHISLQEWGCSTLRNAGRHVVFECESIVSLKIAAPMGR